MELVRDEFEPRPRAMIVPPASELLQDPLLAQARWPIESRSSMDQSFTEQIAERGLMGQQMDVLFQRMGRPTRTIEEAYSIGVIPDGAIEQVYTNLAHMLDEPEDARLVLYLPFELLPSSEWNWGDADITHAATSFTDSYLRAWKSLLTVQDVRANFVDGDVLEEDQRDGDLERVIKAAHLIPKLVERGVMTIEYAKEVLGEASEPVLLRSLHESFLVLNDMGFVTADDLREHNVTEPEVSQPYEPNDITEGRRKWLEQKATAEKIDQASTAFCESIIQVGITPETPELLASVKAEGLSLQVIIEGIRKIMTKTELEQLRGPQQLYGMYLDVLTNLWNDDASAAVKPTILKTFRHLYHANALPRELMEQLGVNYPDLGGPLSSNVESMTDDVEQLKRLTESIADDEELSNLIYPVVSAGGSRLKGYGDKDSDLDVGIFVRPGTPESERDLIRELLAPKFAAAGLEDEAFEFWLYANGDRLAVREPSKELFTDRDAVIADKYWTHILFNAALIGDSDAISELHTHLLPTYFYEADEKVFGRSARTLFLECLEQDMLQYRLMHKGYDRHYPRWTNMDEPHAHLIDGDSAFWDSGYRRVATRLFMKNVFLPKLG